MMVVMHQPVTVFVLQMAARYIQPVPFYVLVPQRRMVKMRKPAIMRL
jgi:hypothetical protein